MRSNTHVHRLLSRRSPTGPSSPLARHRAGRPCLAGLLLLAGALLWTGIGCARPAAPLPAPDPDIIADGARQPAVAPAGDRIAFQALIPGRPFRSEIFIAAGKELRRATQNPHFDGHPSWSADGQRLVFTSGPPEDPEVRTLDLVAGESEVLVSRRAISPVFSPDGQHLVFVRPEVAGSALVEMRLADGVVRELVPGDEVHRDPVFLPSGRVVIYVRGEGSASDIWAVDRNSLRRVPVLATPYREQYPALAPDGRFLVVASDRPLPEGQAPAGNALWLVDIQGESGRILYPLAVPGEDSSYAESSFYPHGRKLAAARLTLPDRWQIVRVDVRLPGPDSSPEEAPPVVNQP